MSNTYNFALRMPPYLGNYILNMSKEDHRPMNTQIILLLEYAIREKTRKLKKDNPKYYAPNPCESDTRG